MEWLENHMHIWDSFNYMVVMIYIGSADIHCRSVCCPCWQLYTSASELTTLHICSVSVNVPVFSGVTNFLCNVS